MRREKYNSNIKENIKKLELDKSIETILVSNGITKVEDIWCLKLDIRKYFYTIDHNILLNKFKERY